jgi:zinc protease
MGAGAGADLTYANVVVMKDSFEAGLRILSDMARKPGFAPEEIERQRQQALSTLRVNFDSPEFVADAVFVDSCAGSTRAACTERTAPSVPPPTGS